MSQQISFALKFNRIPDNETIAKALTLLRNTTNNSSAEEVTLTIKATATIPNEEDLLPARLPLLPGKVAD
jgi:hypothetical protein